MTPSPAAAAGHGSGHNAGGGAASSTTGSSGAAVTGLTGSVTRSEPFFAGELAGVEALSKSASSLATSARVGEIRRRETEVERSETERGVGEVKLDDSWTPKTIPLRKPAPMAKRLSKLVLKSHGECGAYMARSRVALFMVHSEDLAAVEAGLRLLAKTPAEIEEKKKTDWVYFLQRVIPQSDQLADRFDLVHRIYGHLLDAKTKQHLLRAEAWEAWEAVKRLRVHIRAGCLSDPPGVALYFEAGKDSATGCSLFRCVRGMRLLAAWCISPLLGHLLLLEYNYRWNLRQAVNNRGLDSSVGGFHDQPVLEAVQLDEQENDGEAVPLPDLTQSAASLAIMQGVQVPAMPDPGAEAAVLMGASEKSSKEGLVSVRLVRVTRAAWGRQLGALSSGEALVGPRAWAWAVDG
eukprot:jgi/Undpi1/10488/HiC_scaffold_29.g12938.m1